MLYEVITDVKIGAENLIGEHGDLVDEIGENNYGHVIINGEKWQAKSHVPIKKDARVEIIGIEGVSLIVKELNE